MCEASEVLSEYDLEDEEPCALVPRLVVLYSVPNMDVEYIVMIVSEVGGMGRLGSVDTLTLMGAW